MSTDTQTERRGFGEASARKMPGLACIGRVSEIEDGKVTESGQYLMNRIHLEGFSGSRSIKMTFLYRPEWLREGFRPDKLEELEGGNSLKFVYGKNINERGGTSILLGLCGGDEARFDELAGQLFDLEEINEESVTEILRNALLSGDGEGAKVGYTLRQQRTDTGEVDPDSGKKIYVLEPYYEVNEFFKPDAANMKRLRKRAEKSDGKFKVLFEDDEVPY